MLADVNGMGWWVGGEEKLNSLRFETAVTQPFFMVCMQVNSAGVNMLFQVPEEAYACLLHQESVTFFLQTLV